MPSASSTTQLPEVWAVISSALMMSTPAATRVESVRENRAIVTLRTTCPIFIGIFSLIRSHSCRPGSVFLYFRIPKAVRPIAGKMMYHFSFNRFDAFTTHCVSVGSWPPSCEKMLTKTGTRNISIPIRTRVAKIRTIVG